jgi:site-specific recombinase XerD
MRDPANLAALLQSFFTTRLMAQRKVSPHTIASYRDTFRLLLQFAQKRLRKAPSQLGLDDLDASLVGAFLEDLENRRNNGARSRNLRLTAIRSFFRYASFHWKRRRIVESSNECWRFRTNANGAPWLVF